jgi:hypothetical protein
VQWSLGTTTSTANPLNVFLNAFDVSITARFEPLLSGVADELTFAKNTSPSAFERRLPLSIAAGYSASVGTVVNPGLFGSPPYLNPTPSELRLPQAPDVYGTASLDLSIAPSSGGPSALTKTLLVHILDALDTDGVPDAVENNAPNGGSGDGDAIPDRLQENVASFQSPDDAWITLAVSSAGGHRLVNVRAITPPDDPSRPADQTFPYGLVQYRVEGIAPGALIDVIQIYHGGLGSGTVFYKYGFPSASAASRVYYRFMLGDPGLPLGVGAEISGNTVNVHLQDGALGDDDWTANGVIEDPGGPGFIALPALSIARVSPTQAQISWPVSAGALRLQYTENLSPPISWTGDTNTVVTNGLLKNVNVDLSNSTPRFYTLGAP